MRNFFEKKFIKCNPLNIPTYICTSTYCWLLLRIMMNNYNDSVAKHEPSKNLVFFCFFIQKVYDDNNNGQQKKMLIILLLFFLPSGGLQCLKGNSIRL